MNCRHHPNAKHYGLGLCRTCYDRELKWRRRGIHITSDKYYEMLSEQGGTCKFCSRTPRIGRHFDVDHNHVTGEVRGLLCNEHNRALGVLEKNSHLLDDMVLYLKSSG